jgi:hypothetical protein
MGVDIKLKTKLLSLGGEKVRPAQETQGEINSMLTKGKIYSTENLNRYKKGMYPNRCHSNSAFLSEVKKSYRVVTGYALSKDGTWYQHSWLTNGKNIIETTYIFDVYYGYELKGLELDNFILDNC